MIVRNLSLLVIDDVPLTATPPNTIDIVKIGESDRVTWLDHCRSLAREKTLDFDLLSIDILFDRDGTDPSAAFLPAAALESIKGYDSAGLYTARWHSPRHRSVDRQRIDFLWHGKSGKSTAAKIT